MLSPRAFTLNKDAASQRGSCELRQGSTGWDVVKEDGTRVGDAGDAGNQRISLAMPSIKIVF